MRLAEPKPLPPPPFGQQPPPTSGKPLAVGSGPETAARYLGRLNLSLVRAHALNPSSTDPEHPIKTAVGGSRVPPISRSPWLYVESVYRDIFSTYFGASPLGASPLGASALPDVAPGSWGECYELKYINELLIFISTSYFTNLSQVPS